MYRFKMIFRGAESFYCTVVLFQIVKYGTINNLVLSNRLHFSLKYEDWLAFTRCKDWKNCSNITRTTKACRTTKSCITSVDVI
jgi:hypothetical protein